MLKSNRGMCLREKNDMWGEPMGRLKSAIVRTGMIGCAILLMAGMLLWNSTESQAADIRLEKYGVFKGNAPDTYSINGSAVYFYPKKIYYSGKKIICYVYVVNKTGSRINALSDVTLTLRDQKKKTVAEYQFKGKKNLSIANGKYKTVKYTFPKSAVKNQKFYFGKAKRMSIRATYTYHRP